VRPFKADLHIHSCLSPCGDLDMSPRAIVEKSLERGLEIIALCDHNSAENVGAAMRAGALKGLHVFPGMEVCSREEVHVLAIFDREEQALGLQEIVYQHLRGTNRAELFGDQVVVNEFDEVEGFNDRLLIGAAQLDLHRVVREISRLGGLSIAAHVDRPSFSILGQLGFIPGDLGLDGLEISRHSSRDSVKEEIPGVETFPVVSFSDAHFLEDVGNPCTSFFIEAPRVEEIRSALRGEAGRRVES
jgi:PHP family Zn ribbon phosphoesterase